MQGLAEVKYAVERIVGMCRPCRGKVRRRTDSRDAGASYVLWKTARNHYLQANKMMANYLPVFDPV